MHTSECQMHLVEKVLTSEFGMRWQGLITPFEAWSLFATCGKAGLLCPPCSFTITVLLHYTSWFQDQQRQTRAVKHRLEAWNVVCSSKRTLYLTVSLLRLGYYVILMISKFSTCNKINITWNKVKYEKPKHIISAIFKCNISHFRLFKLRY